MINNSNLIDHCMFLFDKPRISYNSNYWVLCMTAKETKSCYFAFHQPIYVQTGPYGLTLRFSSSTASQNNLLARDPESSSAITTQGNITTITLDQLKDRAYLKSIGFLP